MNSSIAKAIYFLTFLLLPLMASILLGLSPDVIGAPFAYIPNLGSDSVTVIDTENDTVVGSAVAVGTRPRGIALHPNGKRAYVITSAGDTNASIDVLDVTPGVNSVIRTVTLPAGFPAAIAISPNGQLLYVTLSSFGLVAILDTASLEPSASPNISTVPVGAAPTGIAVNPSGSRIYVATNGHLADPTAPFKSDLYVLGPHGESVAKVPVNVIPQGIAVHPNGTRVYIANSNTQTVTVLDAANNQVIASPLLPIVDINSGSEPEGVAVNPNGSQVYVADRLTGIISVLDTATNTISSSISLAASSEPFGVSVHPDGTRIYITQSGSNQVAVINTSTHAINPVGVGNFPISLGNFVQQQNGDTACSTKEGPVPTRSSHLGWTVTYEVSQNDGLVLSDIVLNGMAIAAGYSVLLFSGFDMHFRSGVQIVLAMASSCLAVLIIIPALLHGTRPRFLASKSH